MAVRHLQRLGRKVFLGSGPVAGLLLGWTGADMLSAQTPVSWVAATEEVTAPEAAGVQRHYMNRTVIDLPIAMDTSKRALIKEIHLYGKDHPSAPWVLKEKGSAAQQRFRFQAPRDGEFWFTMVTLDKQGRRFPQDLLNERPGLIVVIDTQKPVVELTNFGNTPEGQLVHCDGRDANLDNARVRFFYQGGDKVFRPLGPMPGRAGVYCIPTQAVFTGVVRAVAEDLAGNQTVCEADLNHMQTRTKSPAKTQQVGVNPHMNLGRKAPDDLKMPHPPSYSVELAPELEPTEIRVPLRTPKLTEEPHKTVAHRPDGSDGPRFIDHKASDPPSVLTPPPVLTPPAEEVRPQLTQPAVKDTVPAKRHIVNNTRAFLDYQIENAGANGQGNVEVWLTRDQGKSWRQAAEAAQRKSTVEVQLPGEGVFGLILIVTDGRGAGNGPAAGDSADAWIEVDTTKPFAQITNVDVRHEKAQASVSIHWTAQDKNFGDGPVDLFYAATAQGPWLPIAKSLKADGQHRWSPPAEIGARAHVRLIARDAAGNTAICNTLESVSLEDPSRTRAVIRNVRTEAPLPQVAPLPPARVTPPFQIIQPPPDN